MSDTTIEDGRKIYTVSELNREIKLILEDTYPVLWLEGEVSTVRQYPSGHRYFTLKDADAQISAVVFFTEGRGVPPIVQGSHIVARGRVSAYPKRGEYQFIVSAIEPAGRGALQVAYEQLKATLEKEGLFRAERKRPLPFMPQRIGIVTSANGAAVRDILTVLQRRFATVEVLIYPVKVQGEQAKEEIAGAIRYLNRMHRDLDVLLIGRGGGSYEDLWAFNEEAVVRAIAESRIPTISCVGHETDTTLADFAADVRAPTPSAAAELVVQHKGMLQETVRSLKQRLYRRGMAVLTAYEQRVARCSRSRVLRHPESLYAAQLQHSDLLSDQLGTAMRECLNSARQRWERAADQLHLISPVQVLKRGYAIVHKLPGEHIITSAAAVGSGDMVRIRVADGCFQAQVCAAAKESR